VEVFISCESGAWTLRALSEAMGIDKSFYLQLARLRSILNGENLESWSTVFRGDSINQ
jgi:hypothetical protein